MAVKPWCVGSVLCWVYIISRGWGAWNSSVTWRRTRTDSWACLNKEIGSLRQNLATGIHDYIVCQTWKLYRLHTRVQLWRGGNSPTPSSLRLRFSWVGHILTSLSCSRLLTPVIWLCSPTMEGLQQGPLGSLKINSKGETVGKLTVRTSLTYLPHKWVFTKEMWKKVQIQSRR